MKRIKNGWKKFWQDERGIGTLEIILIIAVIVLIAIAFRKWIVQWVQHLLNKANGSAKESDSDGITVPTP